ncbi:MAG: patatin-like phospholipase family protein [Lewinellaceae bacterium]|nr:patatin-like phospholipase family protein [Lewinellaceae bacterium]
MRACGVLKVLEEAGIRIDYIAGASSGAIVGGMYAVGWTPEQMDSLLHVKNMGEMIQETPDRANLSFFEKQYGEKYALSLSLRDYKLSLPEALSNGQELYDYFSSMTAHVAEQHDFSQLPVPFFCTGTDVVCGSPIIFEHGVLARAIRASASFPGLLAPIDVDGQLVADGGILNNFPAKVMHDKGVDIIIGVNIESGLYSKEQLNSIEKIISQVGSFQMDASTKEQLAYCDIVIHPQTEGFSITSFSDVDTLLNNGERAARAIFPQLLDIAARQRAAPAPPERPRPSLPTDVKFDIHDVHVGYTPVFAKATLLEKFPTPIPGEITFDQFQEGISQLYATDNFHFIDYEFRNEGNDCTSLYINPEINQGYENRLRLGLHYDKVYKSSLLLNGTFRNKIFHNSTASIDLILGDKFRYDIHYIVDNGRLPDLGFNSRLNFTDFDVQLPVEIELNGNLIIQSLRFTMLDFNNEFFVNFVTQKTFEAGLSAEIKYFYTSTSQAEIYVTDNPYLGEDGVFGTAKAYYHFDNRDRANFTRSGILFRVESRLCLPLSSEKYDNPKGKVGNNYDLQWQQSWPLSTRTTLQVNLDAGLSLGTPPIPYRYLLGAPTKT